MYLNSILDTVSTTPRHRIESLQPGQLVHFRRGFQSSRGSLPSLRDEPIPFKQIYTANIQHSNIPSMAYPGIMFQAEKLE